MKRIKSCCARLLMLKLTTITALSSKVTTRYLRAIKATQNVLVFVTHNLGISSRSFNILHLLFRPVFSFVVIALVLHV